MKLASLVVLAMLGGIAHADDRGPVDPYGPYGEAPRARGKALQRQRLRALLIQQFDRNGDGRLEGRERKQAAKALRRLAKQMMVARDHRMAKKQRFIQRFDVDHDGNVGPSEMPPALADELRPLDRDGDGWLENNELP